jgi:protein SCO1/2
MKNAEQQRAPRHSVARERKSWRFQGMHLIALAAVLLALFSGCSAPQHHTSEKLACCTEAEATAPLSDRSLYQIESIWTNDTAKPFRLAELRGQPQIVAMFFTSCQYACPVLVHDLKRIEGALPGTIRSRTGFVLVSFDSERDTPAALAAYRERHQLPTDRWTLLLGQPTMCSNWLPCSA